MDNLKGGKPFNHRYLAIVGKGVHHVVMSDKRHIGGLARLKPVGFAALCLTVLFVAGAPQALAGDDINCSCVANGQRIELGKLFCIKTASGKEFLARCERVLNNTSWKRVQDSCPMALDLSTPTDRPVL